MKFTDMVMGERIAYLSTNKDISVIYELLVKHLGGTIESNKEKYTIEPNFVKNIMFISGDCTDIFNLVMELKRFNCIIESTSPDKIRVDIYEFVNKII